jgi:hypothetical protein
LKEGEFRASETDAFNRLEANRGASWTTGKTLKIAFFQP